MELEGQADLMRQLERIISEMGNGNVEIGFFGGTYESDGNNNSEENTGTSVVQVAIWNEFGIPSNNQPPRPFFRNMIAENQDSWLNLAASAAQLTGNNGPLALKMIGEEIRAELLESIKEFTTPGLAQSTIKAKGNSEPLEDTNAMINSVNYRVNT